MYACSVCKFRTFEDEDITTHVDSKYHSETFKFIASKLDQQTADFLHVCIVVLFIFGKSSCATEKQSDV